jgi:hypothetical protein
MFENNFIYTLIIYKMSGLQFTYRYTGPADQGILLKNRGNNAIVNAQTIIAESKIENAMILSGPMVPRCVLCSA